MMISAVLFWLPAVALIALLFSRLPRKGFFLVSGVLLLLGLIPIGLLTLMQHWASFCGHLSVSLIVWSVLRWWANQPLVNVADRWALLLLSFDLLLFFALAMGVSAFDPYRLGFTQPYGVVIITVLFAGVALLLHYYKTAIAMVIALLAYALNLLPSNNLWDYLLDPILLLVVLVQTVSVWWQWWRKKK